jgi:hypothetical protein
MKQQLEQIRDRIAVLLKKTQREIAQDETKEGDESGEERLVKLECVVAYLTTAGEAVVHCLDEGL